MHLPPPPLWQSWLLENPWPLIVVLVALAAVLRLTATRRGRGELTWAALGCLLLAGGVYLLTSYVTTGRERLMQRTRQLVHATAPLNLHRIDAMLAPDAVLTGPDGQPWLRYDRIPARLKQAAGRYGVAGQSIRGLDAAVTAPGRGRSVLDVATELSASAAYGLPARTQWGLTWRKESDGRWRIVEIRWLKFEGRPPPRGLWR